jgi:molybdenum cofactor guanylyltransferase
VEPFAGIVLAGGRSERMGRPKADLEWRGRSLAQAVCEALERAGATPIVVVGAPGRRLPALPTGVEIVEDARPGRGPLEAIAAGLRALPGGTERVFVSAVDAPFLAPAFVICVVSAIEGNVDAAVPVHGGKPHPLAAAYRVSPTLEAVERRLTGSDLSLRGLLDDLRVLRLEEADLLASDPRLDSLVNLNTPQDYEDAVSRGPR